MTTTMNILLVEDNPGDVHLTREALAEVESPHRLQVAIDGESAMALLRGALPGSLPDLVVLDVQLPGMSGHDVLAAIKADDTLGALPVVVLSGSTSDQDVTRSYAGHASCYVAKPRALDDYIGAVRALEDFWASTVRLPGRVK